MRNLDFYCGPAVYFLYLGGRVVYVGQTTNLTARIGDHVKSKQFDAIKYKPTAPERLKASESRWIKRLKPVLNAVGTFSEEDYRQTRIKDRVIKRHIGYLEKQRRKREIRPREFAR